VTWFVPHFVVILNSDLNVTRNSEIQGHYKICRKNNGAHPASYPMGTGGGEGSFTRSKVAGREADHSRPSSAEVKNAWSCTSGL